MPLRNVLLEFFKLYLMTLSATFAVILSGTLLYVMLTNQAFFDMLRWAMIAAIFLLTAVGFASLLPLSEYSYTSPHGRGRAGVNPAILREGVKDVRKGKESLGEWVSYLE